MPKMSVVCFRVVESDEAWLHEQADEARLSVSVYLRQLVRLARATEGALGQATIFDRHAAHLIHRELRRQGSNINQGVHALNTIAMHLDQGRATGDWMEEFFERAELALQSASDAHDGIESLIRSLDERIILGGV